MDIQEYKRQSEVKNYDTALDLCQKLREMGYGIDTMKVQGHKTFCFTVTQLPLKSAPLP